GGGGGGGWGREDLQAGATAAIARRSVAPPEAGADGVVQRQAMSLQLSGEAGKEVTGCLVGRQPGATFAADGDELMAPGWVECRSHGFSSGTRHVPLRNSPRTSGTPAGDPRSTGDNLLG